MQSQKATAIHLTDFKTPQMRAFHMAWFAFFLCFFAWFGMAPLMPTIRAEMNLQPWQIGNLMIASVAATILARLAIGWLCDIYGPRLCYSGLLVVASLPVMSVGLATDYQSLFWARLLIGVVGGSFVITQYHTSLMFAPNVVGTANATTAGWGNLGGGVTQQVMPALASAVVYFGASATMGWRIAMFLAGAVCFCVGIAYYFLTQDTPEGNFSEVRRLNATQKKMDPTLFFEAARDLRVWVLFAAYAACFGIELTINNMATTYYFDVFGLSQTTAGLIAGLFGLMNLFARTLGGYVGDVCGNRWGPAGRVKALFVCLFCEGLALLLFSQMGILPLAIASMIVFSLFVQMSEGATFAVVPFINKRALGCVSGIVGAGGNVGAVTAGFLFKTSTDWWSTALLILGCAVTVISFLPLAIRLQSGEEAPATEPAVEHLALEGAAGS